MAGRRLEATGFWTLAGLAAVVIFAVAFLWLLRDGRERPLPPLARGIPFGAASPIANPQWTARLARRFPPGSDVGALSSELAREDFTVDPTARRASIKWGKGWPCLEILEVDWKQDTRARLISIAGYHYSACL